MLVHTSGGESHLLDFFVAAPGRGLAEPEPAPLVPIDVEFAEGAVQRFNCGPSSCGVYGTTPGSPRRCGASAPLDLAEPHGRPGAGRARGGGGGRDAGLPVQRSSAPILRSTPEAAAIYEPEGRPLREPASGSLPELGDLLERLGAEGPDFLYRGDVAAAVSDWVLERGGLLTRDDLAAYEVVERPPGAGALPRPEVLTNPPPSSGGILIADALELLERIDRPGDTPALAEVIASTNRARDEEFLEACPERTTPSASSHADVLDAVAGDIASRLGSTTHVWR